MTNKIEQFKIRHNEIMQDYETRKTYKRTHYKYWSKQKLKQRIQSVYKIVFGLQSLTIKDLRTKIKNIDFQLNYSVTVNENQELKTRYLNEISKYNQELDDRRSKTSRYISLKECLIN